MVTIIDKEKADLKTFKSTKCGPNLKQRNLQPEDPTKHPSLIKVTIQHLTLSKREIKDKLNRYENGEERDQVAILLSDDGSSPWKKPKIQEIFNRVETITK